MTGVGLAIASDSADDHFVAELVHALAEPLIACGMGLYTRVVTDDAAAEGIYRHWAGTEGISGVVLLEAARNDPRIVLLTSLGMAFAAVMDTDEAADVSCVRVDVAAAVDTVAAVVHSGPHDRIAFIVGDTSLTSRSRAAALAERFDVVSVERSAASAVAAATDAITGGAATLLFDSDVHAAAAVESFAARGLRIPADVAIVSWTDSALCKSNSPSITAVNRRGSEIGALLGELVLATIAGDAAASVDAPPPFVVSRESA